MNRTSRDRFRELARDWRVVPVWRTLLADLTTPVAAFARLVGPADGFLLESVEHGDRWGRWSCIGRNPVAVLEARGRRVTVTGDLGFDIPRDQGMLAAVEAILGQCRAPVIEDLPPLQGGLVGYLGYDVVREIERLPGAPPDDQGHPDAVMAVAGELAIYDHWRQRVTLISNAFVPDGADAETINRIYDAGMARLEALAPTGPSPWPSRCWSRPAPSPSPRR